MSVALLHIANLLLFVTHTALMLFNLAGWYWPRTRRWHLATLAATLFSWFVMGAWYGWGFCLCADWHFQIRRDLGIHDEATSYLQLQVHAATGFLMSRFASDVITVGALVAILIATAMAWQRVATASNATHDADT